MGDRQLGREVRNRSEASPAFRREIPDTTNEFGKAASEIRRFAEVEMLEIAKRCRVIDSCCAVQTQISQENRNQLAADVVRIVSNNVLPLKTRPISQEEFRGKNRNHMAGRFHTCVHSVDQALTSINIPSVEKRA